MKLTKIKTTMMAGMLAASMILPGMTAFAGKTYSAVLPITKNVTVNSNVTKLPTDQNTVTINVEWVDNVKLGDAQLVKPTNSSLSNLLTNDKTTVTVTVDGAASEGVITENDENILSSEIITAMKKVPGEYTFKVTEDTDSLKTDNEGYGWTGTDESVYYLRCIVDKDQNVTYALTKGSVSKENDDKLGTATFNNTYNKKSTNGETKDSDPRTLTVTKKIKNEELVPADQTYPVTITITAPDVSGNVDVTTDAYKAVASEGSTITSRTADGKVVTIEANLLKDGTVTVSNIAVGATYTVTETTGDWANFKGVTYNNKTELGTLTFTENANATVTVENTFNSTPMTGVVTSIAPYVTLVVLAVAAVAAYMAMKSRVAR